MQRIDTDREKLLNAILFFARSVKKPTKTKIYKLLYFLDFRHFKEVGRSVTGLDYYAWNFGPVPKALHKEIENNDTISGLERQLKIITDTSDDDPGVKSFIFKALAKPDMAVFTPREQKILEELALVYRDVGAHQISEISHLRNQPWDKTLSEKGEYEQIDYLLAIEPGNAIDENTARERMTNGGEIRTVFPA